VLVESLRTLNGTPDTVLQDRQLLELLLPLVRADLEADEEYLVGDGTRLNCPILALGGRGDPTLAPGELAPWAKMTSAEFRLLMLPGDHFFLHAFHRTVITLVGQALEWAAAA
jgi:medium-chain acyl-[acyl-carrier-protein] hydrolase